MCFSATASFAASAVLAGVGAATLSLDVRPEEKPLAAIPIIFAIQQFCEGIVWLSFGSPFVNELASKVFLLAAFALWPFLIPWAFWKSETSAVHRNRMKWFVWLGWIAAIYGLIVICFLPTETRIVCSSIRYDVMSYLPWGGITYVVAIVGAGLCSSSRWLRWFSFSLFAALCLSWEFWLLTTYSTWCFFGAGLSAFLYLYLRRRVLSAKGVLRSSAV